MARERESRSSSRDSGRKSGFRYTPRTAESVKQRAERTGGRFDSIFKPGIDTWRPKTGDNLIRILPPTWEEHDHYGYQIFVHRRVGPDDSTYLCPRKMLNKPCPLCDEAKVLRDAGEADDAKAIGVVEQFVPWIIDRDGDDDTTPQAYVMSWTMDRDVAALTYNKRSGALLLIDHPDEGYDLTIKRSGTGLRTKYFGLAIDREPTTIHDDPKVQDDILEYITENPIPDILHFYPTEYLEQVLSGTAPAKDKDLDLDEEKDGDGKDGDGKRRGRDESEEHGSRRRGREEPEERSERRSKREEPEDERPSRRGRATDDDDSRDTETRGKRGRDEDPEDRSRGRRRAVERDEGHDDDTEDEPASRRRGREPKEAEPEERPARGERRHAVEKDAEPEDDVDERPRHGKRVKNSHTREQEPEDRPRRRGRD